MSANAEIITRVQEQSKLEVSCILNESLVKEVLVPEVERS